MNTPAPFLLVLLFGASIRLGAETLPGTQPLTFTGDFSAEMVAGIDKFLDRQLEASIAARAQFWKRDFSSAETCEKSVAPNRERLRKIIGAVDARLPVREHSPAPQVDGPPPPHGKHRACAAPGKITTPEFASVEAEVARARSLAGKFGDVLHRHLRWPRSKP